jgi:hypothetical protein
MAATNGAMFHVTGIVAEKKMKRGWDKEKKCETSKETPTVTVVYMGGKFDFYGLDQKLYDGCPDEGQEVVVQGIVENTQWGLKLRPMVVGASKAK